MITPEMLTLAGIGVTVILAQRAQNNSLAKRMEEGINERLTTLEEDSKTLQLDVRELKTVCKLRHLPRGPETTVMGV